MTRYGWRVGLIHRDGYDSHAEAIIAAGEWIRAVQCKYGTIITTYSYEPRNDQQD